MNKTINLRVKKEVNTTDELKIRKFKGTLITQGFTEIIHIADQDDIFYLNSFSISPDHKKQVEDFVIDYISDNDLQDTITLIAVH
jgi:hypothetical protein